MAISILASSTFTARSDTAAEPLYAVIVRAPAAAADKLSKFAPKDLPEIVELANFAFVTAASWILAVDTAAEAICVAVTPLSLILRASAEISKVELSTFTASSLPVLDRPSPAITLAAPVN